MSQTSRTWLERLPYWSQMTGLLLLKRRLLNQKCMVFQHVQAGCLSWQWSFKAGIAVYCTEVQWNPSRCHCYGRSPLTVRVYLYMLHGPFNCKGVIPKETILDFPKVLCTSWNEYGTDKQDLNLSPETTCHEATYIWPMRQLFNSAQERFCCTKHAKDMGSISGKSLQIHSRSLITWKPSFSILKITSGREIFLRARARVLELKSKFWLKSPIWAAMSLAKNLAWVKT